MSTAAAIASGVGSGISALGNIYSARQAEENQRRQIAASERFYKNRFRWSVSDMKAAGINPILAASNGLGGSSAASAAGAASGVSPDSSFGSAYAANRVAQKQADLLESETRVNNAKAASLEADPALKKQQQILAKIKGFTEGYRGKSAQAQAQMDQYRQEFSRDNKLIKFIEANPKSADTLLRILEMPSKYLGAFNPLKYISDKNYRKQQDRQFRDKLKQDRTSTSSTTYSKKGHTTTTTKGN